MFELESQVTLSCPRDVVIDVDMVITVKYVGLDMIINVLDLNFSYFK